MHWWCWCACCDSCGSGGGWAVIVAGRGGLSCPPLYPLWRAVKLDEKVSDLVLQFLVVVRILVLVVVALCDGWVVVLQRLWC